MYIYTLHTNMYMYIYIYIFIHIHLYRYIEYIYIYIYIFIHTYFYAPKLWYSSPFKVPASLGGLRLTQARSEIRTFSCMSHTTVGEHGGGLRVRERMLGASTTAAYAKFQPRHLQDPEPPTAQPKLPSGYLDQTKEKHEVVRRFLKAGARWTLRWTLP